MTPTLTITFEYDVRAGLYFGTLENGARFAVRKEEIGGKLESNLSLFRKQVVDFSDNGPVRPTPFPRKQVDPVPVKRFNSKGKAILTLEDLDL